MRSLFNRSRASGVARAFTLVCLDRSSGVILRDSVMLRSRIEVWRFESSKVVRERGLPLTPISSLAEVFPPTRPISEAVLAVSP